MLKKFVQQGRRRVETGGAPSGGVEDFDELRTKLADFFSVLLDSDKLIRLLLHPNFSLWSMPRHHSRGILQGI